MKRPLGRDVDKAHDFSVAHRAGSGLQKPRVTPPGSSGNNLIAGCAFHKTISNIKQFVIVL
jgi:hypothetical protein